MQGSFLSAWALSWNEVWLHIEADHESGHFEAENPELCLPEDYARHEDLWVELYRAAYQSLSESSIHHIAFLEAINDPDDSLEAFRGLESADFRSEMSLMTFLEEVFDVLSEFDELLATRYSSLLRRFIGKYNLRCSLIGGCRLVPTLPGIFSSLIDELSKITINDGHLLPLKNDLDCAILDFRNEPSESRIRACVHRLINLLEALSSKHPTVKKGTLGDICKELKTWPHSTIREALAKLYGFASNYPGIRHGGNDASKKRDLEVRDFIALTLILTAFIPYLTDDIDLQGLYIPGS